MTTSSSVAAVLVDEIRAERRRRKLAALSAKDLERLRENVRQIVAYHLGERA